eukprot:Seg327.5 transcript_id=Seg327.5/GoldUCD/mRNA.D3Y31 product="hypothetical protein" protein_id=Seg327.5/GoldUCD/D3Y31
MVLSFYRSSKHLLFSCEIVFKSIEMSSDSDSAGSSLSGHIDGSHAESSENENTAVRSIFKPYMDKPPARAVQPDLGHHAGGQNQLDNDADEDGLTPAMLEARFLKTDPVASWCSCTKCKDDSLVGSREFCCCREVAEAYGKVVFDGLDHDCVISHPDFAAMTNTSVLKQVGPLLKDRQGRRYQRRAGQTENEYIRAVAYRWLARWFFGYMGWDNTRALPACVYNFIRTTYQSGQSTGYATANERD